MAVRLESVNRQTSQDLTPRLLAVDNIMIVKDMICGYERAE